MKFSFLMLLSVSLVGCANNPFSSYKATSDKALEQVYSGNLATAIPVESSTDVLYHLEHGSLLRIEQQYPVSNADFNFAEQSFDAWANSWASTTSGSLTNSAVSLLLNDNAIDYQPKGYERTFLATYHALNHLDLNNWDYARIEIKRMYQIEQATENYNQALYAQQTSENQQITRDKQQSYLATQILKNYDFKDINSPAVLALKNSYQNAFSHYLAGFVFEALNEPSLARPGYVKAGQLSPNTVLIQQSIDNIDKNRRPPTGTSDVLIVEEIGHAPQIKSEEMHIPINLNFNNQQNSCVNMIDVFFPRLVPDKLNTQFYPLQIDAMSQMPAALVDVNLMAARSLRDGTPHIIARNIAAAVRNIASSQAACSGGGNLGLLLSLGTSLGGAMLDRADERTWTLLPSKIAVNRVNLPYGQHTLTVNLNGVPHSMKLDLKQPYQIVTLRIMGNQVWFNPQN